ncbi:MAG: DUF3460 family protein [Gammaproteobacteria bacterium]|nr:DUF3460 family protein [Gammaproteobacteria bacterium]MBU1645142.1 DUF3460 family protein [Gammaproteobacteria bacterium]MBU1973379.1 DUF3460 family protein [Gammaproteobacteria bacterium]
MAMYESDHTKWMREWLAQHPQELEEQRRGRALWWDKPVQSPDAQRCTAAAHVPQKAYYYDVN